MREAQRLYTQSEQILEDSHQSESAEKSQLIAQAQVYATLAVASCLEDIKYHLERIADRSND